MSGTYRECHVGLTNHLRDGPAVNWGIGVGGAGAHLNNDLSKHGASVVIMEEGFISWGDDRNQTNVSVH